MPAARDKVREGMEQEKVEKGWLIGRWVVCEWVLFDILLSRGRGVASFTRIMLTKLVLLNIHLSTAFAGWGRSRSRSKEKEKEHTWYCCSFWRLWVGCG